MKMINEIQIFSLISIVIGILMIFFNKAGGIAFCKIGKRVHQNNPIKEMTPMMEKIYNEKDAPVKFKMLGIVFIIQGIFMFFMGYLY
jgi:hypothetical protein